MKTIFNKFIFTAIVILFSACSTEKNAQQEEPLNNQPVAVEKKETKIICQQGQTCPLDTISELEIITDILNDLNNCQPYIDYTFSDNMDKIKNISCGNELKILSVNTDKNTNVTEVSKQDFSSLENQEITTIDLTTQINGLYTENIEEGYINLSNCLMASDSNDGIILAVPLDVNYISIPSLNGFKASNQISKIEIIILNDNHQVIYKKIVSKNSNKLLFGLLENPQFIILKTSSNQRVCQQMNLSSLNIKFGKIQ